jgi:hypothetical protein
MRQIESNLKFTIHNLQFTMVFHHVPCTLHPVPSPILPMRQIEPNLKFTIHNLQFTMAFHHVPCTLHPVPSPPTLILQLGKLYLPPYFL